MEYLNLLISFLGIAATSIVAIIAIQKTARLNKVNKVHEIMLETLIEQLQSFEYILKLLTQVTYKVYFYKIPIHEKIESAYDRYWREIEKLSFTSNQLKTKRSLTLPSELNFEINKVIKKLNQAHDLAKDALPDAEFEHTDLEKKVKETIESYNKALNVARKYIGTDALSKITFKDDEYLVGPISETN